MFKFRRKYYSSREKSRKYLSPFWLIFGCVLVILMAEILLRVFIGKELSTYQGEPPEVTSYRLKFLSPVQKPIDGLSDRGKLEAQPSLAVGYQLLPKQINDYWKINSQGFRDDQDLPLAKPKDEIRIFIIGGSTAFGQGNKSNQDTISYNLEKLLNNRVNDQRKNPDNYYPDEFPFYPSSRVKALAKKPKIKQGQYRVINAAVPGYTSGNQLALLMLEISPYKPDLIIVLDGYGDLMLPSSKSAATIPKLDEFMTDASKHFRASLNHSIQNFFKDSYLLKASQLYFFKPETNVAQKTLVIESDVKSLTDFLPKTEEEVNLRLKRWQEHEKQLIRFASSFKIPVVIAIQPEITGKAKLSPEEIAITKELGDVYLSKIKSNYPKFVKAGKQLEKAFPGNVKFLNFYNLNDKFPAKSFVDAIHLTADANEQMAEQIYFSILNLKKMQIIPKNFDL